MFGTATLFGIAIKNMFLAQLTCQSAELIRWAVIRHPSVRPSFVHNYIFDFSKTFGQIHFKLGEDVSWVGFYQVYSKGHGPVICGFVMICFRSVFGEILKYLLL